MKTMFLTAAILGVVIAGLVLVPMKKTGKKRSSLQNGTKGLNEGGEMIGNPVNAMG